MKIAALIFFLFFSLNTFAKSGVEQNISNKQPDTVKQRGLSSAQGLKIDTPTFFVRDPVAPSKRHKPLIVVNGVFYKENIRKLVPEDIESIDVLKGEKAVSLYGKRGRYGVLVIKMKQHFKTDTLINK